MVNGITTSALSQLYRSQGKEYSSLLTQIASGKKVSKPSDDFVGYMRASGISQDIKSYEKINTDLIELREPAQMASDMGNSMVEDLTRMRELKDLYDGAADATEEAAYEAEFTALAEGMTNSIANNKYNGTQIVSDSVTAGTPIASASINPDDSTLTMDIDFDSGDVADVSGFSLAGGTSMADIEAELAKATSYSVKADGYLNQVDRQVELNENMITSKEDTRSSITDVDEAKALTEATELQVRQQATVSMMAQANLSASNIANLYNL